MAPSPLPTTHVYTSCYCEENIFLLADALTQRPEPAGGTAWDAYAVFVSNDRH